MKVNIVEKTQNSNPKLGKKSLHKKNTDYNIKRENDVFNYFKI